MLPQVNRGVVAVLAFSCFYLPTWSGERLWEEQPSRPGVTKHVA